VAASQYATPSRNAIEHTAIRFSLIWLNSHVFRTKYVCAMSRESLNAAAPPSATIKPISLPPIVPATSPATKQ